MAGSSTNLEDRFDALCDAYPDAGFAVYRYDPDGPVTLEIHGAGGRVRAFEADTLALAMRAAELSALPHDIFG